jgi:hypothetical protein
MTSLRQLEANRRNAEKSTGPRTPRGKAVVAGNAIRHGLVAREILLRGESEGELAAFAARLRAQLAPADELERLLVDRIAAAAWRLRRLARVEAALFDEEERPANAFSHFGREKMAVLSRYETTLERSLYRALHELQRLQAERWGVPVPHQPPST